MAASRQSCSTAVRVLYGFVLAFGVLLTAVTIHSFSPVVDPVSPVSMLDHISFLMGVHERSAVVVADLDAWKTTVYTYIFHRHVSDGTFHIADEKKDRLLPGLFDPEVGNNATVIDLRIAEVLDVAANQLPAQVMRLRLRPDHCGVSEAACRPPLLAKVSIEALHLGPSDHVAFVLQRFQRALENATDFYVHPEASVGTLRDAADETALQWFAANMMSHRLQEWHPAKSAVILDVREKDLVITMAVTPSQLLPSERVTAVKRLSAFGHRIKLTTLTYKGLGLYSARRHVFGLSSVPTVTSGRDGIVGIDVRTSCVNPICDAFWQWGNVTYRVRGLAKAHHELVKERNGPFAGKKINRPVANYDQCHHVCSGYVSKQLGVSLETDQDGAGDKAIYEALRNGGRPVFMEGLLKEKSIERGLSWPFHGGDVKMRLFLESLKHACKVPNTDQPFACVDLMFLASLLDQLLGFKQGSMLYSSEDVNGMTAEWPLALAFYVYQNGL